MKSLLRWLPTLLPFVAMSCDLSEVEVPVGEPIVVVQGVMRPDLPEQFGGRQFVVVERSFSGAVAPAFNPETGETRFHEADSITIPYGGYPSTPIEDATVWVSNLTSPSESCGDPVQFVSNPPTIQVTKKPGIYWSPPGCPAMTPGDVLELSVETVEGEVITGTTRIPGMGLAVLTVAGDTVVFGTPAVTTFNRDLDTVRVRVEGEAARMLQVEVRRHGDLADFGTKIYADTTAVTIPGDIINSFVIGDEDHVFRAGRDYVFTVALTDTNYFDYARSENNEYTGRGFINRLTGGIGIFGSLVSSTTLLRSKGEMNDEREGLYRLEGVFNDSVVDVLWELYHARPTDTTEFSAFVQGSWMWGSIDTNTDGLFQGNEFTAVIVDTIGPVVRADTLRGVRQSQSPWQVLVFDKCEGPSGPSRCADGRPIIFRGTMTQQGAVPRGGSGVP